jgi:hypothetical protein
MSYPSHPPWLEHSTYTWRIVQVMKLLTVKFSPTSCPVMILPCTLVMRQQYILSFLCVYF